MSVWAVAVTARAGAAVGAAVTGLGPVTVPTGIGPVGFDVPCDRAGVFRPVIVAKRRRLFVRGRRAGVVVVG